MTIDFSPAVEETVERKAPYVSPEVFDYGDAGSLTKTTSNIGGPFDAGSYPNSYYS